MFPNVPIPLPFPYKPDAKVLSKETEPATRPQEEGRMIVGIARMDDEI